MLFDINDCKNIGESSNPWIDEEVKHGRRKEQANRELYYQQKVDRHKTTFWKRIKIWIENFFKKRFYANIYYPSSHVQNKTCPSLLAFIQ